MIWLSTAIAGDLVAYGPGSADGVPSEDGDTVRAIRDLALPGTLPIWVATGARTELCGGAAADQGEVARRVESARGKLDYGEDAAAREAFADAEALLSCAAEPVSSDVLWDLYFLSGVLAGNAGESEEAVRLFQAAALANPKGSWDDQYNPDIQRLYLQGRERAGGAGRVGLNVAATAGVDTIWLDGTPVDPARTNVVSVDRHLLQARVGSRVFSMVLTVSGNADVVVLSRDGMASVLADPRTPAAGALLSALADDAGVDSVVVVDTDCCARRWTSSGIEDLGWKPKAPTSSESQGASIVVLGGTLVYPRYDTGAVGLSITPLVSVPVAGALAVDVGVQTSFTPVDHPDIAWTLVPILRAGVRYTLGEGGVRPYLGAAAAFTHQQASGFEPGGGGVLGVRAGLGGALVLDVDLFAGAVGPAFAATPSVGVGATF